MAETRPDELTQTALAMLAAPNADTWAIVEYLASHTDALTASQRCDELLRQLYNERKLLAAFAMGRAAVQFGLSAAAREANPKRAEALRSAAKTAAYNLAANTWPGWDDPGVTLTSSDLAIGLDAARTNLRLARELNKPEIALGRAHWLLGAHQLAAGDRKSARDSFREASKHETAANEPGEAMHSDAFAQLCDLLEAPNDKQADERLAKALESLRKQKDGEFFASQVDSARRVFGPK